MNRRLLQFLQAQNITQAQFADTLSVARGSVSHILSGRNKPGYEFLESLALHYPTLSMDWILTGKGTMFKGAAVEENDPALFSEALFSQGQPLKIKSIMVFFEDNTFKEFLAKD